MNNFPTMGALKPHKDPAVVVTPSGRAYYNPHQTAQLPGEFFEACTDVVFLLEQIAALLPAGAEPYIRLQLSHKVAPHFDIVVGSNQSGLEASASVPLDLAALREHLLVCCADVLRHAK